MHLAVLIWRDDCAVDTVARGRPPRMYTKVAPKPALLHKDAHKHGSEQLNTVASSAVPNKAMASQTRSGVESDESHPHINSMDHWRASSRRDPLKTKAELLQKPCAIRKKVRPESPNKTNKDQA